MIAVSELKSRLVDLVNDDLSLDDFEDWFTVASWNSHLDSSSAAQKLVGAIELRLNEYSSDHLSREELMHEFMAMIQGELVLVSLSVNLRVPVRLSIDLSIAPVTSSSSSSNINPRVRLIAPQPALA